MSHLQAQQHKVALSHLPGIRTRSRNSMDHRRFRILPRSLHLQLVDIDKSY